MKKEQKQMTNAERIKFVQHKKIIAVDPGKSGGIVIYSVDDKKIIEVIKMPETHMDIYELLKMYQFKSVAYLEKVGGRPGQGGSRMFNFGCGYGWLQMAFLALRIPTRNPTPQAWQKALGCGVKGNMTDTQWKNKLKAMAQEMYPELGVLTLDKSDALLILEYARHQENNKI